MMNLNSQADIARSLRRLRFVPRLKRSLRKRYIRLKHGDDYFITQYFGAKFLVHWQDVIAREIALQNFENVQLENFIAACLRIRPELFIDVGANGGLYSCVLLKGEYVPRSLLFEPDRRNFALLQANLLINGLLERADRNEVALGDAPGHLRFAPGPESNTGLSRFSADPSATGYEVKVVRLDDVCTLRGAPIALKIDIEGFELQALNGMVRVLDENQGVAQIETTTMREEVIRFMRARGFEQSVDLYTDLVFEKP